VKEGNRGVRDKILPKSTENLLHQKRERCKGNIELERDAVATDYIEKGRGAYSIQTARQSRNIKQTTTQQTSS
jgi:hypothetical protein